MTRVAATRQSLANDDPLAYVRFGAGLTQLLGKRADNAYADAEFDYTTQDFAWQFKWRGSDPEVRFLQKQAANVGYDIWITGGKARFRLINAANASVTSATAVNDGDWHTIKLVNSRNVDGKLHIYIDGVLDATSAGDTDTVTSITNAGHLEFGYSYATAGQPTWCDAAELTHWGSDGAIKAYFPMDLESDSLAYTGGLSAPYLWSSDGAYYLMGNGNAWSWGTRLENRTRKPVPDTKLFKCGLSADLHHKAAASKITQLDAAIVTWNAAATEFNLIDGDIIDGVSAALDPDDVAAVVASLAASDAETYAVLGNHDRAYLTVADFMNGMAAGANVTAAEIGYYSFDHNAVAHVVVLGCDEHVEGVPKLSDAQLTWLAADLAATDLPVVVFFHARIDGESASYHATNADECRAIIEAAGNVLLVVTGHEHGMHQGRVNGIAHLNVDDLGGGAYGVLTVWANGEFALEGFGGQRSFGRR